MKQTIEYSNFNVEPISCALTGVEDDDVDESGIYIEDSKAISDELETKLKVK